MSFIKKAFFQIQITVYDFINISIFQIYNFLKHILKW